VTNASARPSPLCGAFCGAVAARLCAALNAGDTTRARLLLRVVAALGAVGAVSAPSAAAALAAVARAARARAAAEPRAAAALAYCALAALPWFYNTAGAPLAARGGCADAEGVQAVLIASRAALDGGAEASAADAAAGACAGSVARATRPALDGWLDAPAAHAASLRVDLSALACPPARRLLDALAAAAPAARAAASVARPQDDPALAALLLGGAGASAQGEAADAAMADGGGDGGAGGAAAPSAAGAEGGGVAAVDFPAILFDSATPFFSVAGGGDAAGAGLGPLPDLPPAARWFVRPPFYLFGAGGLSSTPTALATIALDGPAATPINLWALREVAWDT
jgi:hypothetical protein